MKIAPRPPAAAVTPTATAQKTEAPAAAVKPAALFQAAPIKNANTPAARQALAHLATHAATEAALAGNAKHPVLESLGESAGLALGVIVTEALSLSKSWNAPLRGADGKPVEHIEGADRIGDHDLRKRHEEVVGPKVAAWVAKLEPGLVHDLLEGFAKGATEGPGASYRLESKIADWLK